MQLFLYSKWLSLPINTRIKIANQFNIQKRGSTEVVDNQIKSDGYAIKEIEEALNIDAIQTYLEVQETDMMTLWIWLIDKIEGRELTVVNIDTTLMKPYSEVEGTELHPVDLMEAAKQINKPKRGRKPKSK